MTFTRRGPGSQGSRRPESCPREEPTVAHPIEHHLEVLRARTSDLFHKDFLLTWEHPRDQIEAILSLAEVLKELHRNRIAYRAFESGLAISIFRDNSTRTRFSFAAAANALGFGLADLDEEKSQIAHGETVRETANMISFMAEVIGIRDDMFLGEGNKYMREVGAALSDGLGRACFTAGRASSTCSAISTTPPRAWLTWPG